MLPKLFTALIAALPFAQAIKPGVRPISELKKLEEAYKQRYSDVEVRAADAAAPKYPAQYIDVPVDHFHNESRYEPHSDGTFKLRYFFDAQFYKPGGPVFVLSGGETDVTGRFPYMQKGILYILSKATGGMSVLLEHRYYGKSFPTPDLSTPNLRFDTTQQALADSAHFAQNVVFKGFENKKLTSNDVPWIFYGGSYAGAFVAIARVAYPKVWFGAISSSGVTEAITDYWRYFIPIERSGPATCIATTKQLINAMDNIFLRNKRPMNRKVLNLFGASDIQYANDFAEALANYGIYGWQGRNWDPAVNSPQFSQFCGNISSQSLLYPALESKRQQAEAILQSGGYGNAKNLTNPLLNWVGLFQATAIQPCIASGNTPDQCFTTHDPKFFQRDDYSTSEWRSWAYQYCTQWGYFQSGSSYPKGGMPLVSRIVDVPYLSIVCRDAFNITSLPNTQETNKYGGYNIAYSRLAFIDGGADPWREAGTHADAAKPRKSTDDQPFYLIPGAVHHWDENGLLPDETTPALPPDTIRNAHTFMVNFVKKWLKQWPGNK